MIPRSITASPLFISSTEIMAPSMEALLTRSGPALISQTPIQRATITVIIIASVVGFAIAMATLYYFYKRFERVKGVDDVVVGVGNNQANRGQGQKQQMRRSNTPGPFNL